MESVPLKELKRNLSKWVQKASHGESVRITKHNRPLVRLISDKSDGLIWGKNVGKTHFKPAMKKPLKIDWQKFWDEDRNED